MSDPKVKQAEQPAPSYRPFTPDDIGAAHALSSELNWPHRADDWRFVADAGTGFVAEDASGVIGTALCWKYGSDTASLGMVIVSPEQQGRGIGRKLMELLLEELGDRTTLLHATPAGKPLYEKLGFREIGTLHQHQGAAFQPPLVSLPPGERLRPLGSNDAPRLIELASRASGLDRSALAAGAARRRERHRARSRRRTARLRAVPALRPRLRDRPGRRARLRRIRAARRRSSATGSR